MTYVYFRNCIAHCQHYLYGHSLFHPGQTEEYPILVQEESLDMGVGGVLGNWRICGTRKILREQC